MFFEEAIYQPLQTVQKYSKIGVKCVASGVFFKSFPSVATVVVLLKYRQAVMARVSALTFFDRGCLYFGS